MVNQIRHCRFLLHFEYNLKPRIKDFGLYVQGLRV